MPATRAARGTLRKGVPLFFCLLFAAAGALRAETCAVGRSDARARSAYVYDGDTFRTAAGEKVRLIGVNTPEMGKDGAPDEPLAAEARALLEALLDGNPVRLQYGSERHDRYGRTLAHVALADGRNLAAVLLERGLATALYVPPNLGYSDCYRELERGARTARRGLWALPAYQVRSSAALTADDRGYRLVRGRIEAVKPTRKSVWLELAGRLSLRVPRADLALFREPPERLVGRTVVARGWIHPDGRRLRMTVRHPYDLEPEG